MTTQSLAATAAPSRRQSALAPLLHVIAKAWAAHRTRQIRAAKLAELAALTDDCLADIGLSREDIAWARSLPPHRDAITELRRIAEAARPGPRRRVPAPVEIRIAD